MSSSHHLIISSSQISLIARVFRSHFPNFFSSSLLLLSRDIQVLPMDPFADNYQSTREVDHINFMSQSHPVSSFLFTVLHFLSHFPVSAAYLLTTYHGLFSIIVSLYMPCGLSNSHLTNAKRFQSQNSKCSGEMTTSHE